MTHLHVILDGDNAWPDMQEKELVEAESISVALLEGGMASGAASVAIRFDLPDGSVTLGQTSLKLFLSAARAFQARAEAK